MNVYGPLKVAQLEWFAFSGLPSASGANTYRVVYVTDKKQVMVSDGTQWNPVSILSNSLLADLPAASAANQYQTWYTTDDNILWVSTGASWLQVNSAPADGTVTGNKLDMATVSMSDMGLNIGLAASVAANAMTIELKTKAGTDASASDYINVAFRNSTAATGTYVIRKITGALSTVISSNSTGGSTSGNANWVYVYLIDNAGTVELAWSATKIADEGSLVTTTAEGGAGGADSKTTLYSTTARSNVACRLIGRIKSTQATAGTWATAPSEIAVVPFNEPVRVNVIHLTNGNGHGSSGTYVRRFSTIVENIGTAMTYADSSTNGMSVTINEDGIYVATYSDTRSTNTPEVTISKNASSLSAGPFTLTNGTCLTTGFAPTNTWAQASFTGRLYAGDVIRAQDSSSNDDTSNRSIFRMEKLD